MPPALPADLQALVLAGLYTAGVSLAFAGNRTALHVGVGNLAWLVFLFRDPRLAALGALGLLVAAVAAHGARSRLYDAVLDGQRDAGPVFFFLALALVAGLWAAGLLPREHVLLAFLPMAFADPVGFYVGRAWGKHRLRGGKSVEGFLAVLGASLVVTLALASVLGGLGGARWLLALLAALGSAFAELVAPSHTDNLLMPVGALVGLAVATGLA